MKLKNYIYVLATATVSLSHVARADEHATKIEIDRGNVVIEYVDQAKAYEISIKKPAECQGQITLVEGEKSAKVSSDPSCQRGADITVKLKPGVDAAISLQNGNIRLAKATAALKALSKMKATATIGTIQSSVPGLLPTRVNNFMGAEVIYKAIPANQNAALSLQVQTGMLQF